MISWGRTFPGQSQSSPAFSRAPSGAGCSRGWEIDGTGRAQGCSRLQPTFLIIIRRRRPF